MRWDRLLGHLVGGQAAHSWQWHRNRSRTICSLRLTDLRQKQGAWWTSEAMDSQILPVTRAMRAIRVICNAEYLAWVGGDSSFLRRAVPLRPYVVRVSCVDLTTHGYTSRTSICSAQEHTSGSSLSRRGRIAAFIWVVSLGGTLKPDFVGETLPWATHRKLKSFTLPETNMAPENGWLEY